MARAALLALALAGCATDAAPGTADADRDETRFTAAVAGLIPDTPTACLQDRTTGSALTAIGPRLLYRVGRELVYVTRTNGGCERVARGDILVTNSPIGRLCSGDIARTVNVTSGVQTGSCALGEFVAYRAAR